MTDKLIVKIHESASTAEENKKLCNCIGLAKQDLLKEYDYDVEYSGTSGLLDYTKDLVLLNDI